MRQFDNPFKNGEAMEGNQGLAEKFTIDSREYSHKKKEKGRAYSRQKAQEEIFHGQT